MFNIKQGETNMVTYTLVLSSEANNYHKKVDYSFENLGEAIHVLDLIMEVVGPYYKDWIAEIYRKDESEILAKATGPEAWTIKEY